MKPRSDIKYLTALDEPIFNLQIPQQANSGILVGITDTDAENQLSYLSKILNAVGFELSQDIILLNLPQKSQCSLAATIRQYNIHTVILFGLTPESVGLQIQSRLYQPISVAEVKFLFADVLSGINGNDAKRSALWLALKQIFNKA